MIIIGASSGGLNALIRILPNIPKSFSFPIIIVQHLQENEQSELHEVLNKYTELPVTFAHDKDRLTAGMIFLAPPGYHLLIEAGNTLALSIDPPVSWARPSIDVLFESAALFATVPVIAVVLTGASSDGSKGLNLIKKHGGLTIVQDPATADVAVMPQAAIDNTEVDYILPLDEIGNFLTSLDKDHYLTVNQYETCTA